MQTEAQRIDGWGRAGSSSTVWSSSLGADSLALCARDVEVGLRSPAFEPDPQSGLASEDDDDGEQDHDGPDDNPQRAASAAGFVRDDIEEHPDASCRADAGSTALGDDLGAHDR